MSSSKAESGFGIVVSCLLFWPAAATADIVNLQSILATEASEGLSGAFTASADYRTGNASYLFLSGAPVARYRDGDHLVVAALRGERKVGGGTTLVWNTFEHLRYQYTVSQSLVGEMFLQHAFDRVRRLNLRALAGAGPKIILLERPNAGISVGVAYMFEYERIRRDNELDSGKTYYHSRISSYLLGRYAIDDRVQFVQTVYAQPRIGRPSDFRLLNESQLAFQLSKHTVMTTTFTLSWDTAPPATIRSLDTGLESAFTWNF